MRFKLVTSDVKPVTIIGLFSGRRLPQFGRDFVTYFSRIACSWCMASVYLQFGARTRQASYVYLRSLWRKLAHGMQWWGVKHLWVKFFATLDGSKASALHSMLFYYMVNYSIVAEDYSVALIKLD